MSQKDIVKKTSQMDLPFTPVKHVEIEGIAMGVLDNGTPYFGQYPQSHKNHLHQSPKGRSRLGKELSKPAQVAM